MSANKFESCESKSQYSKRQAQEIRNRHLREGVEYLRIYQCEHCNFWHLTKRESWEDRQNSFRDHQKKKNKFIRNRDFVEEDLVY